MPPAQAERHGKLVVANHDRSLKLMVKPYVDLLDAGLWVGTTPAFATASSLPRRRAVASASTRMFKWKSRHTIDVWVGRRPKRERDGDRIWTIKVMRRRQMVTASEPLSPVMATSSRPFHLKLVDTLALDGIMDSIQEEGLVLECGMQVHLDESVVKLYPIRHRTDKTHPNSIVTIESTIENVLDHIEVEDLIQAIEGGAEAYVEVYSLRPPGPCPGQSLLLLLLHPRS